MVYYYYTDGSYTIPPTSTRGHSSIKKWSYSPKYLDDTYVPEFVYPRHRIDTTGEENDIRRSVNKELMFSSHAVEDTYDMASKSRNRDQEILRSASQAIVDTETYHSPKAAVASRRARSQPPSSVTVTARTTLSNRSSVPPRATVVSAPSYTSKRGSHKEVVYVVSPKRSYISSKPAFKKSADINIRVGMSKVAMAGGSKQPPSASPNYRILPYRKFFVDSPIGVESRSMIVRTSGKALVLPLYSRAYHPKTASAEKYFNTPVAPKAVAAVRVYASPLPYRQKRLRKAALVGSKVDVVVPKRKRPRSKYAQAVVREMNLKKHDESQGLEIPQSSTGHLHASPRPVLQSETQDNYRPISDVRRRVRRVICKNRKDPSYYK